MLVDFTKNGKCSGCGQCCMDTPCVTKAEVRRIAKYVVTHGIRPHPNVFYDGHGQLKIQCPFRDVVGNGGCLIYPARPLVCKTFMCNMGEEKAQENLKRLYQRPTASCLVSLQWLFCGDPTTCEALRIPKANRGEWLGGWFQKL